MSVLYFDAFSGASGDMILGSLIHLGLDFDWLKNELSKLKLDNYSLSVEKKMVSGIDSIKFHIEIQPEHHHRHLSDIVKIIEASDIHAHAKEKAMEVFELIAVAEAKIHGTTKEKIHFHEVGAMDSIIDIVGVCVALTELNYDKIYSSPLPMGRGFVKCAHGKMPLPAPATLEILKDYPGYGVELKGEFVTPTGAALLKCWVDEVGEIPKMTINKTAYGAGTIEREIPNLLRVIEGELIDKLNQGNIELDTIKKNSCF